MEYVSLIRTPTRLLAWIVAVAVALSVVATLGATATVRAATVTLTAELTAEAEVPTPGPTGATGTAVITIDDATGEVCYELTVAGLDEGDPVVAAHIHAAEAGVAGDVVVPLFTEPPTGEMTGCVEGVDLTLLADIIANPDAYYVNIHTEAYPAGAVRGQLAVEQAPGEPEPEVYVMKHLCNPDIQSVEDFEAVEAAGVDGVSAEENPFAGLVATVLACPTIVHPGDTPTPGAVTGGNVAFEFTVTDANGTLTDPMFEQAALCEDQVGLDANGDGTISADTCLDVSNYSFAPVAEGMATVTEVSAPPGSQFGILRVTPGSGDDMAVTSALTTEPIELDTAADPDNTAEAPLPLTEFRDDVIMLHVYNFQTAAAPQPTPSPTPPSAMPDTAASPQTASAQASFAAAVVLLLLATSSVVAFRSRRARL